MESNFTSQMATYAEQYALEDGQREQIIHQSRSILKSAKQAIYALHRDDLPAWESKMQAARDEIAQLQNIPSYADVGAYRAALEECVEAVGFAFILREQRLPAKEELDLEVSTEIYLQGLSDCSGEMVRKAIAAATIGDTALVKRLMELVQEMQEGFLQFDFRGGELRKKSDSLRRNLAKLEQLNYEVARK